MKWQAQALLVALNHATIIQLDITVTKSDVVFAKCVRATLLYAFFVCVFLVCILCLAINNIWDVHVHACKFQSIAYKSWGASKHTGLEVNFANGNVRMKINEYNRNKLWNMFVLSIVFALACLKRLSVYFLFNFRALFTVFPLMSVLSTIQGEHICFNMFQKNILA